MLAQKRFAYQQESGRRSRLWCTCWPAGCAWRHLPPTFGVSLATAHRRFTAWTKAGLWRRLHRAVLDQLGARAELDWSSGPNPVDRGKSGSKLHVLSDAQGIPLVVGVSAANTNDILALKPMVKGIPAVKSRHGPRRWKPGKLRADKAYHSADTRAWLRELRITPRIARPGIESSERLGRHRWKIERSFAWLFDYRRLAVRYERKSSLFLAFLGLADTLTGYKELSKLNTCGEL